MSRLKIVTGYDSGFAEVGDIAAATMALHAALHGYDLEVRRDMSCGRPPSWAKVPHLLEALRAATHDFVAWVDADAFFRRHDRPLLTMAHPSAELTLVAHQRIVEGAQVPAGLALRTAHPNMGVFIMRGSAWNIALLERMWERTEFVNHHWWEQAAFYDVIGYRLEISGGTLPNALEPDVVGRISEAGQEWNATPVLPARVDPSGFPLLEVHDPVIVHLAGVRDQTARAAIMRRMLASPLRS